MILLKKYESLDDVLIHIKKQVLDSIDYAEQFCPRFTDPQNLFYWLFDRVVYVSDPNTIELIMTMETMMKGNRTGVPGGGDCDDFTITALACLISQGFTENKIILAGRNEHTPVHIFCETYYDNEWVIFDLTENKFNSERKYKFYQELNFVV